MCRCIRITDVDVISRVCIHRHLDHIILLDTGANMDRYTLLMTKTAHAGLLDKSKPFYEPLNKFIYDINGTLMPNGFDTTADEHQFDTLDKIKLHYYTTGRVAVWSGASDDTIFGLPSVNHAFRAWHDWGHIHLDAPFNMEGELKVLEWQNWLISKWHKSPSERLIMQRMLDCEIRGQLEYQAANNGQFPPHQRSFALYWLNEQYGLAPYRSTWIEL